MSQPDSLPPKNSPPGLSLTTFFVIAIVVLILGIAGLGAAWYFSFSDKAKLERQVRELETQKTRTEVERAKADAETKIALAKNQQSEILVKTRQATNVLESLLQSSLRLNEQLTVLKTNEVGRMAARHPDLVIQARRLYENEFRNLSPISEVVQRLENARRLEYQLASALGTTFQPETNVLVAAQSHITWAEAEQIKVNQADSLLSGLQREAKIKVNLTAPATDSPNLAVAISQLNEAELTSQQRTVLEKTEAAKKQASATIATAEAQRIIDEAKLKAEAIVQEANDLAAKQKREQLVRTAETKIESSKAAVAVSKAEDEAQKVKLRLKASDTTVQGKLAPFITPGYVQIKERSYDKHPHSLTQLRTYGALDSSVTGLGLLVNVATVPHDTVRPRWKMNPRFWSKNTEQYEKVKEAQQLLVELGPVLVEMGLLDP